MKKVILQVPDKQYLDVKNKLKKIKHVKIKEFEKSKVILTKREIQVLRSIMSGLTNDEIADKLEISKRTVDSHKQNLQRSTNTKNTVGLVRFSIKNDYFDF